VRATNGPETFSEAAVRGVVFQETDDWIRETSFGQASLAGDVTPWLHAFRGIVPECRGRGAFSAYLQEIAAIAGPAARSAGFDPAAYEKVVYLVPWRCPDVSGVAGSTREIGLFGALDVELVAHELGHTFGIWTHANTWSCRDGACRMIEYGDPYDVMGHGPGQFNAWEKFTIGWLTNVARASMPGVYTVDHLERPTLLPQALVVTTARNEYWFEHREPVLQDAFLAGSPLVGGLFVRVGRTEDVGMASDYPEQNILLPNPAGRGPDALLPGDTFGEPGAFELTVTAHVGTHVDVRFRWTDATRPARPANAAVSRAGRTLRVTWDASSDRGSGVARYDVALDGRRVTSVASDFRIPLQAAVPAAPGRHVVTVAALDRAGNRGLAARRIVRR
jgi:Gametolysin peptidase M11